MRYGFSLRRLAAAAGIFWSGALSALEIADRGRSDYAIVVAADAIPAEKTAAAELQRYVKALSGVELPIVGEPRQDGKHILIGRSPAALELLGDTPETAAWLKRDDAIIIETVDGNLILSGARPRGTLYAVYTLLERFWQVRFWTSTEESVPAVEQLGLPDRLSVRYAPQFLGREVHYWEPNHAPQFAVKLKSNGHFQEIPVEWGGHLTLLGFVHTLGNLLPASQYFEDHPDWYALDESGARNGEQPCWSNPAMLDALKTAVLKELREHPDTKIISVSQNDGWLRCHCDACAQIEAEEGSPAGPIIRAVNAVAAAIEPEFPEVLVETLAYVYSQTPPAKVKPRRNVLIRLCCYQNDFCRPYDSAANETFRQDFLKWKAISSQLAIWNYVTNFSNYLIPHPNTRHLGDDLRFFADNKVATVFEQGDIGSGICGDFVQMRAWVVAQLLWDPYQDQRQLMKEFLNGYYSPAAGEKLLAVIDLMTEEFAGRNKPLGCYRGDVNDWLSFEALQTALRLFDEAAAALADRPAEQREVLAKRLRRARLPYDLALVCHPLSSAWNGSLSETEYAARLALWEDIKATYQAYQVTNLGEIPRIDELYRQVPALLAGPKRLKRSGEVPEFCKGLPEREWFEFSADNFALAKEGLWTFPAADERSPYGKTVRMPNNHIQWAVNLPLPELLAAGLTAAENRWRAWISVRAEGSNPEGVAILAGVYDAANRKDQPQTRKLGELDGYHWIDLGEISLGPSMSVYAAPVISEGVDNIYIDRIILARQPKQSENL